MTPIGIQAFRTLRERDCYYVDKTAHVRAPLTEGTHYPCPARSASAKSHCPVPPPGASCRRPGVRSAPVGRPLRPLDLEGHDVASLPAELHPDEVYRLAEIAVLVGVPPRLQLGHRRPLGGQLEHLELEQVHVAGAAHRHVQPPVAAAVLRRDVQPERCEVRVEDVRLVPLVAGDVVVRVPLVRNAREERVETRA